MYILSSAIRRKLTKGAALVAALTCATALPLYAQGPWGEAVARLEEAFTGPIARGLSLVAIVIGGLLFAFSEGDAKRTLAGIIFGVGMATGSVAFLSWLFT